MDLFRTPGASLEGADKKKFDETKELIDSATNDFLVRADWNANMSCVDKINSIHNTITLNEIMFLLRKKIASKSSQTVGLTMQLVGSLVNNCGLRFHTAMNDEKFIRAIGDAIRYFSSRPGLESKEVTDNSLDLVQSWGEAFLPKRKQFYHIVDLYFTLRKEGLPFKTQQFDPSRVPIFTDNNGTPKTGDETDAILAAALQSSLEMELRQEDAEKRRQNSRDIGGTGVYSDNSQQYREEQYHDNPRGITTQQPQGSSSSSTAQEVESLQSCMGILKDLILAATHQMDFRHNEVAQEVLAQLLSYQSKIPSLIEQALMSDAEGVETLIALNEASQSLSSIYNKIKSCETNLVEGQRQTRSVTWGGDTTQESFKPSLRVDIDLPKHTAVQQTPDGSADLLGMGDYSPYNRTTPSGGHHPVHHSVAQHAMAAHSPGAHHSPSHHSAHHSPNHHSAHPSPHRPPAAHTHAHPSPGKPPVGYHTSHPEYPVEYPVAQTHSAPHYQGAAIRIPPPGQHGHGHSHGVHHPTAGIKAPSPVNAHGAHHDTMKAPSPVHNQGVHYSTLKAPSPVHGHGAPYLPAMHAHSPAHIHAPTPSHAVKPKGVHAAPVNSKPDEVITPANGDPFAPDALDALFGTGSPPAQPSHKSPTKVAQQPPPPVGSPEITGKVLPQPADHFAPEALDALFDTKPPAPVSGVKADPFSDAALDALFDTPAPPAHHHGGHQHYVAQQHPHYPPAPPAYAQHPQYHPAAHPQGGYPGHPQQYPPQYHQQQQQHQTQYPQHAQQHPQHTQQRSQQQPQTNPFDLLDS